MSPSPAAPPSILIVDDEARIRDLLVELLADEGYAAVAVADGQAALDYLHAHPAPCCIVLDLYMPIMDGWQFHRAHLRTPALADIPVVVMSAVAAALQPLAWFQAAGYLQKPFAVDAVLALVVPLCDPSRLRP
jgi:CheY-like chemotaxis protein